MFQHFHPIPKNLNLKKHRCKNWNLEIWRFAVMKAAYCCIFGYDTLKSGRWALIPTLWRTRRFFMWEFTLKMEASCFPTRWCLRHTLHGVVTRKITHLRINGGKGSLKTIKILLKYFHITTSFSSWLWMINTGTLRVINRSLYCWTKYDNFINSFSSIRNHLAVILIRNH